MAKDNQAVARQAQTAAATGPGGVTVMFPPENVAGNGLGLWHPKLRVEPAHHPNAIVVAPVEAARNAPPLVPSYRR